MLEQMFLFFGWLQLDAAANLATTVGVVLGVWGAGMALITYNRSASDAAASHMHGLFRDYLKLRLDWETRLTPATPTVGSSGAQTPDRPIVVADSMGGEIGKVVSFKLYTLEEMYAWVRRHSVHPWLRSICKGRASNMDGWRQTIIYHLSERVRDGAYPDASEALKNLAAYPECYGDPFLKFVAQEFGDQFLDPLRAHLAKTNPERLQRIEKHTSRGSARGEAVTGSSEKPTARPDELPNQTASTTTG